jgi:hypothetical protein
MWDKISLPLRDDELCAVDIRLNLKFGHFDEIIYDVSPSVRRLLSSVVVEWKLNGRHLVLSLMGSLGSRNARYVIQKLRQYPCLLTCPFGMGTTVMEFLSENAAAPFVEAGVVGANGDRGLIYCRNLEDAALVRLRFKDIQVRQVDPSKLARAIRETDRAMLDASLGDAEVQG